MASANKRLMNEFAQNTNAPVEGTTVTLPDETDIHTWLVSMTAPKTSVYSGGVYKIHISLPKDYPFKPPVLSFKTKIYHPNVSNDDKGSICLGMLRSDQWKPPNKIADVLKLVRTILAEPQPDDAVETNIADQFKRDYKGFEKVAREWVTKYAKA